MSFFHRMRALWALASGVTLLMGVWLWPALAHASGESCVTAPLASALTPTAQSCVLAAAKPRPAARLLRAEPSAGMCDDHAASVIAPVAAFRTLDAELSAGPSRAGCDEGGLLASLDGGGEKSNPTLKGKQAPPLTEVAILPLAPLGVAPAGKASARTPAFGLAAANGFGRGIYHPPTLGC